MREALGGRFISVARADLAAALFGACDGVPAHFGVSIAAIEQESDCGGRDLSDGRQERFDLVVGADGLHSRVREIAFGPQARLRDDLWAATSPPSASPAIPAATS